MCNFTTITAFHYFYHSFHFFPDPFPALPSGLFCLPEGISPITAPAEKAGCNQHTGLLSFTHHRAGSNKLMRKWKKKKNKQQDNSLLKSCHYC